MLSTQFYPMMQIFCPPPQPRPSLQKKTLFYLYFTINSDMALPTREVGYFSWLFEEGATAVHNLAHSYVTAGSHWP